MLVDEPDNPSPIPRNKAEEIEKILAKEDVDLWALRELCLSEGGLVNDSIRRKVWPKLVGIEISKEYPLSKPGRHAPVERKTIQHLEGIHVVDPLTVGSKGFKKQIMARCLDSRQIDLDIGRCTWHLLTGNQRSRRRQMRNKHRKKIASLLKRKQRRLGNLINLVLVQSYAKSLSDFDERRLRYYQGYHDISSIFLSALGGVSSPQLRIKEKEANKCASLDSFQQALIAKKTAHAMGLELPSKVLLQISQCHLRDCMKNSFEALTTALRLIIMPLIAEFDKEVHDHLKVCGMEPFFCFPWIISWFSHDIRDTSLVKRLFDVFIVSHPLMPIYMSIAMVLHQCNREEVLNTECDFASLHKTLSELPRNSCNVGWKFVGNQFGGSYISGDEDDDVKVEAASILSDDMDRESLYDDEGSLLAPSLASESIFSGYDSSRVPFQELIDLSIKFMRHVPPRKLLRLAHKYHGHKVRFFSTASSINLFQEPPEWALRASIPSDWALKKHIHKATEFEEELGNEKIVTESIYPRAAIACGIGPDGESESKRRFWRRKRLQISVVAVGIVAVVCGLTNDRGQYVLGSSTIKHTAKVVMNRVVSSTVEVNTLQGIDKLKQRTMPSKSDSKPLCKNGEQTDEETLSKIQPVKLVREIAESAKTGLANEAQVIVL